MALVLANISSRLGISYANQVPKRGDRTVGVRFRACILAWNRGFPWQILWHEDCVL